VIDVNYIFNKIAKVSHQPFGCTFSSFILTGERKIGCYSEFLYTCGMCGMNEKIKYEDPHSSLMEVNIAAVTGAVNSGQGYT
jgi:hypothetical protein